MNGLLLWDFDGTLAAREGMWAGCLVEVLDGEDVGHGHTLDLIRPFLRDGFPWHDPAQPHPELEAADAWWAALEPVFVRAFAGLGYEPARARRLAGLVRARYTDCSFGWSVFPDVLPVLTFLRGRGWRHAVLSNHVPELAVLVEGLGLGKLVETVHTSAVIGYEKPHPAAFAHAIQAAGSVEEVWMIGDNIDADVLGAEAAGLKAMLVRRTDERARHQAADLYAAARLLANGTTSSLSPPE